MSDLPASRNKPSLKRPPVNQYYRGTATKSNSPFVKKKPLVTKKRWLTKFIDYLVIIVVVLGFLYSLIVNPHPKIVASSSAYNSLSVYQVAADKEFSTLTNRTKLTVDEKSIGNNLQKQFPEINSTNVDLPIFGQKPILHLEIAAPSFFIDSGSHRYVVDSLGVAVGQTDTFKSIKSLPIVDDQSGFNVKVGAQVLSTSSVDFINQLVAQCKESKISIAKLTLPPLAQELDLHTSDKKYFVKFYLGGNSSIQIGQFLAARHQFANTHQDPSQYLDVRVAGKIYYL